MHTQQVAWNRLEPLSDCIKSGKRVAQRALDYVGAIALGIRNLSLWPILFSMQLLNFTMLL